MYIQQVLPLGRIANKNLFTIDGYNQAKTETHLTFHTFVVCLLLTLHSPSSAAQVFALEIESLHHVSQSQSDAASSPKKGSYTEQESLE